MSISIAFSCRFKAANRMILAHKGVAASNMVLQTPFGIENMPTINTLKHLYMFECGGKNVILC
jgi:hypothetical protein